MKSNIYNENSIILLFRFKHTHYTYKHEVRLDIINVVNAQKKVSNINQHLSTFYDFQQKKSTEIL